MKVTCQCGNDIATMKGCRRNGPKWFCKVCGANITRKKLSQLVQRVKENW